MYKSHMIYYFVISKEFIEKIDSDFK